MTATREYLQLHIAPGGEPELAALEGRMGMPLSSGDTAEGRWWFSAATPEGGSIRLFAFASWQRVDFSGLLGQLDSPSLRLSIGPMDLTRFRVEGPGAAARGQTGKPPIILPMQVDRLFNATGRKRQR